MVYCLVSDIHYEVHDNVYNGGVYCAGAYTTSPTLENMYKALIAVGETQGKCMFTGHPDRIQALIDRGRYSWVKCEEIK